MKKQIILVDIDGTVSQPGERLKYLKMNPPDWDSFYNDCFQDEPIKKIIDLVNLLSNDYRIVFCTGRRESVRDHTIAWLTKHMNLWQPDFPLLMRRNNDKHHDTVTKPELLIDAGIALSDIYLVLEDRNSMVAKWRSLGLTVLQVADGDF